MPADKQSGGEVSERMLVRCCLRRTVWSVTCSFASSAAITLISLPSSTLTTDSADSADSVGPSSPTRAAVAVGWTLDDRLHLM